MELLDRMQLDRDGGLLDGGRNPRQRRGERGQAGVARDVGPGLRPLADRLDFKPVGARLRRSVDEIDVGVEGV